MAKYYTHDLKQAIDEQIAEPKSTNRIPGAVLLNRSLNNTNCTQRSRSMFLCLVEARREHDRTRAAARLMADALGQIEEEISGNPRKTCWLKVDEALAAYESDEALALTA